MYIVTGGAGFIGSNLVKELVIQGEDVFVVDNLSTGSKVNLEGIELAGFCSSIEESLDLVKDVEGIYHLGIPSSTPLYDKDPYLVAQTVGEFTQLQQYIRDTNVKMVMASTSNLYNGNPLPWKEGMPIHTTSLYTETRYYLERMAELYNNLYDNKTVIMRFFSVYGYGEESKKELANLISQMIWAKKENKPFVVYGNGEQTRDSVFVTDLIDALITAMHSDIKFDIFNVGTGKSNSVNRLAELIGVEVKLIPNPLQNYVQNQLADISKIRKHLDWRPTVSIEEGIKCLQS
jgi:UDP-glucose 4-epimerase